MEMEMLFSEQKWNILRELSSRKASPLQLAGKLNTTIANISQQLRLLEASKLVKTEKVQARERGKPRKLFSLSDDFAYVIFTIDGFAGKKLLELDYHHKVMMNIWFVSNPTAHHILSSLFWTLDPYIALVSGMYYDDKSPRCTIITDKKAEVEKRIAPVIKRFRQDAFPVDVISAGELQSRLKPSKNGPFPSSGMHIIFDQDGTLQSIKNTDSASGQET